MGAKGAYTELIISSVQPTSYTVPRQPRVRHVSALVLAVRKAQTQQWCSTSHRQLQAGQTLLSFWSAGETRYFNFMDYFEFSL